MHEIPILMLHSVNSQRTKNPMGRLSVSPEGLEMYLRVFQKWHYQMISITDLIEGNYDENRNYIVLTFDDGYKDNLTIARSILEKYHAHATIFVNPGFFSEESDQSSDWGFMTWDEVQEAEASGVFDIQAHTMTHDFIFVSDKIVDQYTPEKFEKYYWLAWILFPDSPRKWDSNAYTYRDMIPTGYPIFEYGRRITHKRFVPNSDYVEYLIRSFQGNGFVKDQYDGSHGELEGDAEYRNCVAWEIVECKHMLENRLQKSITSLCFPGSGYNDYALQLAKECGYKCYMIASKLRTGNNHEHLENIRNNAFDGFNRMSFSFIYPAFLPKTMADEWMAKITLGNLQRQKTYVLLRKVLSKIWHT